MVVHTGGGTGHQGLSLFLVLEAWLLRGRRLVPQLRSCLILGEELPPLQLGGGQSKGAPDISRVNHWTTGCSCSGRRLGGTPSGRRTKLGQLAGIVVVVGCIIIVVVVGCTACAYAIKTPNETETDISTSKVI